MKNIYSSAVWFVLFSLSLYHQVTIIMEFCRVVLTCESVDKILRCDHSNKTSLTLGFLSNDDGDVNENGKKAIDLGPLHLSPVDKAGARFSKAPIINGPVKLLLSTCKIEVS